LQDLLIESEFGEGLLQSGVFLLQFAKVLQLIPLHAAVLLLPAVVGVRSDAELLASLLDGSAAGQVSVDPSGTSFSFSPPAGPAGTVAPVRVRVNGADSDPALWVTL